MFNETTEYSIFTVRKQRLKYIILGQDTKHLKNNSTKQKNDIYFGIIETAKVDPIYYLGISAPPSFAITIFTLKPP